MDVLVLIGRVLFGMLFVGSAVGHLTKTNDMASRAESRGIPMAKVAVASSGVLLLVGGLMMVLGGWVDLAALLLVVFLVPTAVLMHAFWKESDEQTKYLEQVQFMKDMAMAGAALMLFVGSAISADLGLTITGPLISLN